MDKKAQKYEKQYTALTEEEMAALESSAETDMRGEAQQLRYLAVEKMKDLGLLKTNENGSGNKNAKKDSG